MAKYIQVYEPDGFEYEQVLYGSQTQLKQLQDIVGGYIEVVQIGGGEVAIVNEEGLIHGLPYNQNASMLAGLDLVGTVVIMDYADLR